MIPAALYLVGAAEIKCVVFLFETTVVVWDVAAGDDSFSDVPERICVPVKAVHFGMRQPMSAVLKICL